MILGKVRLAKITIFNDFVGSIFFYKVQFTKHRILWKDLFFGTNFTKRRTKNLSKSDKMNIFWHKNISVPNESQYIYENVLSECYIFSIAK